MTRAEADRIVTGVGVHIPEDRQTTAAVRAWALAACEAEARRQGLDTDEDWEPTEPDLTYVTACILVRRGGHPYRIVDSASGAGHDLVAMTDEEAEGQAREWLEEGYEPQSETFWADGRLYQIHPDGREEHIDTITIRVDPEEPECSEDEHNYRQTGVHGHGGGVIVTEACEHCGVTRRTNTWAQRPDTGEQGLRSVSYSSSGPDDDGDDDSHSDGREEYDV